MVSWVHTRAQTYQIVPSKYVQFIVYQLYLSISRIKNIVLLIFFQRNFQASQLSELMLVQKWIFWAVSFHTLSCYPGHYSAPCTLVAGALSVLSPVPWSDCGLALGFLTCLLAHPTTSLYSLVIFSTTCTLWRDKLHICLTIWLSVTFYLSQSSKNIKWSHFLSSLFIYLPGSQCSTVTEDSITLLHIPFLPWFLALLVGISELTLLTCQNPGQTFLLLQSDLLCHFSDLTTQKS